MKRIFTFFAAALVATAMSAVTVFTFTTADLEQTQDGFTVTLAKGEGNNPPSNSNNDKLMRMYPGNTITITGAQIQSLQVKFALGNSKKAYASASANVGTYVSGGTSTAIDDYKIDSWTGDAQTVVITIEGTGQRSIHELVIGGEGGGTDDPVTPPAGETKIEGLALCDAYYWRYDYDGTEIPFYDFDLYKDYDDNTGYVYPEVYLQVMANSMTSINGTYDLLYAAVWTSANDSVELSDADDAVATVTIKNTDNNGNYSFTGSFTGTDNKTYTFASTVAVSAIDDDNQTFITLDEEGTTPEPEGTMFTCAQAAAIAAATGYKGTQDVTVFGYITELGQQKTDDKTGRNKQTFFMSDAEDGAKTFEAFWAFVPEFFKVGDRVQVTGILQNYKGTIEIADGEAAFYTPTAVSDVSSANVPAQKVVADRQLVIIRNGVCYNVLGAVVQ